MNVLTIATVLLVVVAVAAAYFVARASIAIQELRALTRHTQAEISEMHGRSRNLLAQTERTEQTVVRVVDKFYRTSKEIEAMLQEPAVQRALRQEGRN